MRRRVKVGLVGVLAVVVCVAIVVVHFRSLSYIHGAEERPYDLWKAALAGFEGPIYYVGSEGDFSYFRAGSVVYTRYKAQTSRIKLSRTFPFGKGEPYLVAQEMVPYY